MITDSMSADDTDLGELFVDITGERETVTERTAEPSRDPVDEDGTAVAEEVAAVARNTGLEEAVSGTDAEADGALLSQ